MRKGYSFFMNIIWAKVQHRCKYLAQKYPYIENFPAQLLILVEFRGGVWVYIINRI
jgi:hypothetical protein